MVVETGPSLDVIILAVIVGTLAAIVYSLRILVLLERRIARVDLNIERITRQIVQEEEKIEHEEEAIEKALGIPLMQTPPKPKGTVAPSQPVKKRNNQLIFAQCQRYS